MADTKVSALADIVTLAAGDKIPVADASDLTASKSATMTEVALFVVTAPVFTAGTASANTAPKLSTGTLNSTPEAGAFEYLTNTPYFSPSASNRGVLTTMHVTTVDADVTGTNGTAVQSIFPAAQDRLTVIASTTYLFELFLHITCGATSTSVGLAFDAGTCSYTSIRYWAIGSVGVATDTTTTTQSSYLASVATISVITAAGTGTTKNIFAKGSMRINAGGTMVPQFKFSADPTGTILVKKDSYMTLTPIGSNTVASVGNWS